MYKIVFCLFALLSGSFQGFGHSWKGQAPASDTCAASHSPAPNYLERADTPEADSQSVTPKIPRFILKGQVTDIYNQPLKHVLIIHNNSLMDKYSRITDTSGYFSTPVYAYECITIKRNGYVPQKIIALPENPFITIKMYPDACSLAGLTIWAVSPNKKKDSTDAELVDFFRFYDLPAFPGGNVQAYIQKRLHYPEAARQAGIEGEVIVSFIIDEEGNPKDFCIVQSVSEELDAEALRVLKLMPQWKPAYHRGKAIPFRFTISINFQLQSPISQ